MKIRFLKPIAAWAVVAATAFSCAGTNDVSDNTGMEPTQVVVTETEVAAGTTPDGTTVVVADRDVVADTTVMMPDRENMANTDLTYNDMFEDVADTEQYNVLALARTNPDLSTFVQLVELSGLAQSFQTAEPVTVFAPTNAAFNELPQERLASLIDPNNRTELVKFINMHVLPSEVSTISFSNSSFIDRGEDEEDIPVTTTMNGTVVYVGGAQIVKSNVEAANGILHVVDGVIEASEAAGPGIQE